MPPQPFLWGWRTVPGLRARHPQPEHSWPRAVGADVRSNVRPRLRSEPLAPASPGPSVGGSRGEQHAWHWGQLSGAGRASRCLRRPVALQNATRRQGRKTGVLSGGRSPRCLVGSGKDRQRNRSVPDGPQPQPAALTPGDPRAGEGPRECQHHFCARRSFSLTVSPHSAVPLDSPRSKVPLQSVSAESQGCALLPWLPEPRAPGWLRSRARRGASARVPGDVTKLHSRELDPQRRVSLGAGGWKSQDKVSR